MTDAHEAPEYLGSEGDLIEPPAPMPAPEEREVPEVEEFDVGRALALVDNREAAEVSLFPERSELEALAGLAVTFAASGLVPKDLRGKPNDVLVVLLTARELRIDYMTALRECAPINGKVTLSPKLRIAMILQRGIGDVWYDPANNAATATVYGQRTGSDRVAAYTFTWDDAVAAGLADKRCKPNDTGSGIVHWEGSSGQQSDRTCKCDMYRKYGRNMLKWRAGGYLCDEVFPDVGTGLYSAEELGGTVDEDGRAVLDVASAEALPGMKRAGPGGGGGGGVVDDPPISAEDLADLERRIPALPAGGVDALRELWSKSLPKPQALLARQVKVATAMLASIEKRAEAGEWGEWRNWTRPEEDGDRQRPEGQDFQAGAGKSPHDLARERRAREAQEQVTREAEEARGAVRPQEHADGGDGEQGTGAPAAQEGAQEPPERGESDHGGTEATACVGCGEPFAFTASGKPSTGGKGRDAEQPDYHRDCAPF